MANPKIQGLSETEETLLYQNLRIYNRGRTSYKEEGAYIVVLPRPEQSLYSLWIYSPLPEKQSVFFLCELAADIYESMRMASTLCLYSNRPLYIMEYHAKQMHNRGDDLIAFGKYHGHYLHEILRIDPAYLSWIAYKFEPRIPKQERFVQIAKIYHSVYLDILHRRMGTTGNSRFLGKEGERIQHLTLTILNVRIEDNPYRTHVQNGHDCFYVRQILRMKDEEGNLVTTRINARSASWASEQLPAAEHSYQVGEVLHIASARIASTFVAGNEQYTRISHIKFD